MNVGDYEITRHTLRERDGTAEEVGLDGILRVHGYTPVPGTDWIAIGSIPADEVYAGLKARIARSAVVAVAILAVALLLVLRWSRRIEQPIAALAAAAEDAAGGNGAARAPIGGPQEIAEVATQFNRMIEARERAQRELGESERRFRDMLAGVELIAVILDRHGCIVYCNEFLLRLTGWRLEEIAGRDWFALLVPDPGVGAAFLQALEDRILPTHYESEIVCKSGERRLVHWNNTLLLSPTGEVEGTATIGEDITERRRDEMALRERERLLAETQRIARIGSWRYELAGPLVWSEEMYRIYGVSPDTFSPTGETFLTLIHPEDRSAMQAWIAACMKGEGPGSLEFRALLPDGRVRTISGRGELHRDDMNRPIRITGTAQDITDRKQGEDALRESRARLQALARRLLEVQETERRAVARELHDEVGGMLTAVQLNVQSLRGKAVDVRGEEAIADVLSLVNGSIESVRSLSLDLRPAVLDDLGLVPALKWYCERHAQRSGASIEHALDGIDLGHAPQLESACFRIAQESMTNALRHASARHIRVALRLGDGDFEIEIADDGRGFDTAAARRRARAGESSGLLSMEERTNLLGGEFSIESTPGTGTRIRARFSTPPEEGA